MNAETKIVTEASRPAQSYTSLVRGGFEPLTPLVERMVDLENVLIQLERLGDQAIAKSAGQLRLKLQSTEASVTMIGQVKAGKTSLTNAMIGWPDLLPADVNPWTSVVTSLHMTPRLNTEENKARFRFFNSEEWDRLVLNGGRVGELAGRAGADSEIERVRRQIAEMQEKSRRRLGRKFELLLGQCHEYGEFDGELIERYVCLGDDFEDDTETSKSRGRFADITKSAELFLHRPEFPIALCLRDTPGVNDTFMVREQITIRSIRDSRICVVVLSAHQALSSVDMALVRLISNVKSREVLIFVNRIDELPDPAKQIPEIQKSIVDTLRAHQGPADAKVIFGSAYWANVALQGRVEDITGDSETAMENWAAANARADVQDADPQALAWRLSGVPALFEAISARVAEGPVREVVDDVVRSAKNLAGGVKSATNVVRLRPRGRPAAPVDRRELAAELTRIAKNAQQQIDQQYDQVLSEFEARLDRSHNSFLQRATAALINHLEREGDGSAWKYDPTGLRVLFRSAYQLFSKRANDTITSAFATTASDFVGVYRRFGLIDDTNFEIEPPRPPRIPPPVLLGQTIALDLQLNWWSRWWRKRRGYQAFADEFHELIRAETAPMVDGLCQDHAIEVRRDAHRALNNFIKEQTRLLASLLAPNSMSANGPDAQDVPNRMEERQKSLSDAMHRLSKISA
ncbi:MAG: dynamin family protein [Rhodobacter sp.]|nr:dynamin family protein [Rhodobacter sp.]